MDVIEHTVRMNIAHPNFVVADVRLRPRLPEVLA